MSPTIKLSRPGRRHTPAVIAGMLAGIAIAVGAIAFALHIKHPGIIGLATGAAGLGIRFFERKLHSGGSE